MKNKSSIAGVVLAGLATGAAAWYLMGTSNGKQICHKMSHSVKDLSNTVKDKAGDAINKISGKSEPVSNTVMA